MLIRTLKHLLICLIPCIITIDVKVLLRKVGDKMGRPFLLELNAIGETFDAFSEYDIEKLYKFTLNALGTPVLAIGSGGAYAVAKAFSLMITLLGGFGKTITPFELLNERDIQNTSVIIFTAGGNNSDTLNAFKYIQKCEPLHQFVLCLNRKSKLKRLIDDCNDESNAFYDIPNGKDGFLAVNSTIGMLSLIRRVHNAISSNVVENSTIKEFINRENVHFDISKIHTIIALSGEWSAPVADDFESKCTEAGLINVQLANLRNFAHGRHHWIAKHQRDTAIVAFISPSDEKLYDSTVRYLPDLPKIVIRSSTSGFDAILEQFPGMLQLVANIGNQCGIDPGRPQVPDYGSKIYHISFSLERSNKQLRGTNRDTFRRAVCRKNSVLLSDVSYNTTYQHYYDCVKEFYANMSRTQFRALVLDYDNTVINDNNIESCCYRNIINILSTMLSHGIVLGFATGRGMSIREQLCDFLPQEYWGNVWIAYYNGNYLAPMSDSAKLNVVATTTIKSVFSKLNESGYFIPSSTIGLLAQHPTIELKNNQITVTIAAKDIRWVRGVINEIVRSISCEHELKILESDHSIDIICYETSKESLYRLFREEKGLTTLCIGDSGNYQGNDYELLTSEFSLSVDKTSISPDSCWNLAPPGYRGPRALEYYLGQVSLGKTGTFTIDCE